MRTLDLDSNDLLNKIIYTVGALIIVLDSNGKITRFNRKCEEITGFKEEEIIGKSIWDFLKQNVSSNETNDVLEILLNSILSSSFESEIITKDGREIYVLWNNSYIKDENDNIVWTIGTGIDITERVKAENEIKKLNEDLEKRVKERTEELEKININLKETLNYLKQTQQQLIESEKMASLGSLVAGVSHEINTPVGVGITAVSFIEKNIKKIIEEFKNNSLKRSELENFLNTTNESINIISSNLNRAAELITSFKKVAVDQTTEEKRVFNIKEYLNEIFISLRPKLKKKNIDIIINCNDNIEIDSYPGLFSQIFTNLIMNSFIHGFEERDNGEISIDVQKNEKEILFIYKDNGKGILEENIKKIFDPFWTTKRNKGGTGLGLHITYNIITQKLNGSIKCESKLMENTIFTIRIPII